MNDLDKTTKALKREKQRKARLERNLSLQRERLRKADARRKIQLGGLIVKAELEDEPAAILLGILDEAKKKLASKDADKLRAQWQKGGDAIFKKDQIKTD